MNDEKLIEVHRQLRIAQDKYIYFLLAVAAAAVAYAIKLTQNSAISLYMIPLGLAVLLWGGSFFCGCHHLRYVLSALYANADLLRIQKGEHPLCGNDPQMIELASNELKKLLEQKSDKAEFYASQQFNLLIVGSVLFIAWHIIGMVVRMKGQ